MNWQQAVIFDVLLPGALIALGAAALGIPISWIRFTRAHRRRPDRRTLLLYAALLLAPMMSIAGCLIWLDRSDPFNQRPFDAQVWRSAPYDRNSPRGKMTRDLIRHHLRSGMSRAEVVRLLGEPQEARRFAGSPLVEKPGYEQAREVLTYPLGAWSGFRMDMDLLDVAFDEQGRVIGAWHWQS